MFSSRHGLPEMGFASRNSVMFATGEYTELANDFFLLISACIYGKFPLSFPLELPLTGWILKEGIFIEEVIDKSTCVSVFISTKPDRQLIWQITVWQRKFNFLMTEVQFNQSNCRHSAFAYSLSVVRSNF